MKISSKLNELKPIDLNCNVFDVYSYDGLSMQELLCQFFTKINECVKVSNETIDLASWLVNEGLKIEVVKKLMLWLEDGTLENLINVNLFNTLHTKIERIENNINITPDDFEGSDIEKIQQVLDYALENNINTITLNRIYDLTGGTIYYNGVWATPPTFKDGTLIKNDKGFMFSRQADDNQSNSPLFLNVSFEGDTKNPCYIIDGDKLLRQGFQNCQFKEIALIKTINYVQSLRLDGCEMSFSPDVFINCPISYDVNITNNKFEESHHALIKSYSNSTDSPASHALRITNNLIEGYVVEPPIILSSAYGLSISNNYFESNHYGDIEFIKSNGVKTIQGLIENNSFFKSNAMWNIKSHNTGNYVNRLFLDANISTIGSKDGKSFTVGINYSNIKNTSLTGGGRLVPIGTDKVTSGVMYEVINDDGYSAIRISPHTNTKASAIDGLGQSYLVKFSGTFGSSVYYRSVFVGILTVGGNYDSENSVTCREARLTHLASTLMQGNTGNSNLWDSSYVTIKFESTGTNKISTTVDDNIIIRFNKIPYNATYSNGFVKNIEGLLGESIYMERVNQD